MAANKRDYYEVLGVSKSSSVDEIKSAYRKMAIKFHPDKNPGNKEAEEKFKEATEAYEILSNPEKKQAYDNYGFDGVNSMGGGFSGSDFHEFQGFEDIFGNVEDFFGSFFGSGGGARSRGRSRRSRGSDLRYDLNISMEDVYKDTEVKIKLKKREVCTTCGGSGAKPGTKSQTCPTCGGVGAVRQSQGFFSIQTTCPRCQGTGKILTSPCITCNGTGLEYRQKTLAVKIPAGVEDGTRIRIPGEGEGGEGGSSNGDLYVVVNISPHKYYERHGRDLYCRIPISIFQATLGTQVELVTLDGKKVSLKIPSGTQNGRVLRLHSMGLPGLRGSGKGDLNAIVSIQVPEKLSGEEKSLMEKISKLRDEPSAIEPLPLTEKTSG